MTDLDQLLPLWQELKAAGVEYVLATVVAVEGSGYRKPGARMLLAADGRRTGTISGGCLEGDVVRKAFWHTEHGPVIRRYSTKNEDGDVPFGMGCGGVVHVLLERSATAGPLLEQLSTSFAARCPLAVATVLQGSRIAERAYFAAKAYPKRSDMRVDLTHVARQAFEEQRSFSSSVQADDGRLTETWAEWIPALPGLFVFGAGDDAVPLVRQARQLGWFVAVADGRSNLVTRTRFPEAHELHLLTEEQFPSFVYQPTDAAVVMTHSLQQDTGVLRNLLMEELNYIGVLGPRRRTADLLFALALECNLPEHEIAIQTNKWLSRVHAPMGLDLGGDTPAEIALSVIAEIQQTRRRTTGRSLRAVRAHRETVHDMSIPSVPFIARQ